MRLGQRAPVPAHAGDAARRLQGVRLRQGHVDVLDGGVHAHQARLREARVSASSSRRIAAACALRARSGKNTSHCAAISSARRRSATTVRQRRGPVSARAAARPRRQGDHRGAAGNGREPFRRIAATLGVSEATVRARYAQARATTEHPPGDRRHEPARPRLRGAGDGRRPDGRAARDASRTRSRAGTRPTTSSSRPASSTCSSSSSAPTGAGCSTSRTASARSPDVISTESFLYLELWKQLYDWGVGMSGARQRGAPMTADGARRPPRRRRQGVSTTRARSTGSRSRSRTARSSRCSARRAAARRRRCG